MTIRILGLLILVGIPSWGYSQVYAQDLYQYNYTTISPAFAGIDGMKITAMGNFLAPKYGGTRYATYAGFEGNIGKVGGGLTWSNYHDDFTRIYNVSLPVNYQFKLGETRKLVVAARASYFNVTDKYYPSTFNAYNLDPDLVQNGGEYGKARLNGSLAVLYKGNKFYTGLSVDNNTYPAAYIDKRENQYNIIVGKDFGGENLESNHSLYVAWTKDQWLVDLNNNVIIKKKGIIGASFLVNNDDVIPKLNAGYRFGSVAQVVVSLYSKNNEETMKKFSGQLFLQFNIKSNEPS